MNRDHSLPMRRRFLRRSLAAMAAGSAFFAAPRSLSLLNAAWAQSGLAGDDYKALVCVFLHGGNDGHNLIVPRAEAEYAHYANRRRGLAIPRSALLPITPIEGATHALGLHPAVPELQQLFEGGQLAVLANVGALLEPVTREAYDQRTARLPPQLFSHNDQQDFWQSLEARSPVDTTPASGWAGRVADLLHAGVNPAARVAMNHSLAGANPWQVGRSTAALAVDSGEIRSLVNERDPGAVAELEAILALPQANLLVEEYRRTLGGAVEDYRVLRDALALAPPLETAFPPPPEPGSAAADRFAFVLGRQLRRVAELISVRAILGLRRHVFFCSLGGFDTHDAQMTDQPELLAGLSRALGSFHASTVELGVDARVTTFGATEFGRSMTSNGDGSDHARRRVYGAMPDMSGDSVDFAGDGNLIPRIAVDQYGATLGRWFGVPDSMLDLVFPNLAQFDQRDLGFMQPG
jgi:uncharacterized protein (DUF1501 family)